MTSDAAQRKIQIAILAVTPFQQNCSLIWEDGPEKRGAIVDPGGDVPRIVAAIKEIGFTPEKIILTHGHIDHAGGAAALKEVLGGAVPIEGPDRRDKFLLDNLDKQGRAYGLDDARPVTPDRWLTEGDVVRIAGQDFSVLHCPGHTPGHVVFVNAPARLALVGDVLFKGSIGRTDFPYGDHEALLAAIREKLYKLGDDVSFVCGHGPGSTIGAERRSNPYVRG